MDSANDVEGNPNYPKNKEDVEKEIKENKSIDDINKTALERLGDNVVTFTCKVLKYTTIGAVTYGIYVGLIEPPLRASAGCHYNVNSSSGGSKVVSNKVLKYSCADDNTNANTNVMAHPFETKIDTFVTTNSSALITGMDMVDPDNNTLPTKAHPICSVYDVSNHGNCGGYCSFAGASVLEFIAEESVGERDFTFM